MSALNHRHIRDTMIGRLAIDPGQQHRVDNLMHTASRLLGRINSLNADLGDVLHQLYFLTGDETILNMAQSSSIITAQYKATSEGHRQ